MRLARSFIKSALTFYNVYSRADGFASGRETRVIAVVGRVGPGHQQLGHGARPGLLGLETDAAPGRVEVEDPPAAVPRDIRRRHREQVDGARQTDCTAFLDVDRGLAAQLGLGRCNKPRMDVSGKQVFMWRRPQDRQRSLLPGNGDSCRR